MLCPPAKKHRKQLLLSAASLWITNILVFALWYWRLDAGGPYQRDKRSGTFRRSVPLSADDYEQRGAERSRPAELVAEFHRLFVSRLQHQYRFFAHRRSRAGGMGEDLDDAAIVTIAADHCALSCACGQHSVIARGLTQHMTSDASFFPLT